MRALLLPNISQSARNIDKESKFKLPIIQKLQPETPSSLSMTKGKSDFPKSQSVSALAKTQLAELNYEEVTKGIKPDPYNLVKDLKPIDHT